MYQLPVIHRLVLLFLALVVVVTANDDSHEGTEDGYSTRIMPCGNSMECGTITVPLDWFNSSVGYTEIQFARAIASRKRKGTIFVDIGIGLMGSWATPYANMLSPFGKELHDSLGGEYDVLMWATRGKYYDEELTTGPDPLRCFDDESQRYALFSEALNDSIAERHWTYTREWLQAPDEPDARQWYRAQEAMIARCLEQPSARVQKYVGTAATVRDIIAMADTFDGPGSPVNLWSVGHGSITGGYLMTMFPERVGRVVLDDPVDPVAYNQLPSYQTWQKDVAAAHDQIAKLEAHCLADPGTCRFASSDEYMAPWELGVVMGYLRTDLIGWRNAVAVDRANKRYEQMFHSISPFFAFTDDQGDFEKHIRMIDEPRGKPLGPWTIGTMPIACGDALYDHDPDAPELKDVETTLIADQWTHSLPLLMARVFPSYRYLCHLWPIRAVERVKIEPPPPSLAGRVLVVMRQSDPWNYFRVDETAARTFWPEVPLVSELPWGPQEYPFRHAPCNLDLIRGFFVSGEVPDAASRKCQEDPDSTFNRSPHDTGHRRRHSIPH